MAQIKVKGIFVQEDSGWRLIKESNYYRRKVIFESAVTEKQFEDVLTQLENERPSKTIGTIRTIPSQSCSLLVSDVYSFELDIVEEVKPTLTLAQKMKQKNKK